MKHNVKEKEVKKIVKEMMENLVMEREEMYFEEYYEQNKLKKDYHVSGKLSPNLRKHLS